MFTIRHSRLLSLFVSFAVLVAPLPIAAMAEDIGVNLSEWEINSTNDYSDTSYIYLGKELSNIAEVISAISDLENEQNSPICEFKKYIEQGFVLAEINDVVDTVEYASSVLQKKDTDDASVQKLTHDLNNIIDHIEQGILTVKASHLGIDQEHYRKNCCNSPCNSHRRKLVVKEKVNFLNTVKFKDDVTFYDDVTFKDDVTFEDNVIIDGTLSVTDLAVTNCIDSLCVNNLSVTDLVVLSCIDSLCVDNLSVVDASISGTLSVNNAIIENASVANLTVTATVLDSIINNLTVVSTLSANDAVINNATITNFSATDAVLQNLTVANCIPNLCVNNLSIVEASVSGTLSVNDEIINNFLRFNDLAGGEYVGLQAPAVVPTSYTLSLPSTVPTAHQVLRANAATPTDLEWFTSGGSVIPAASKIIYVTKYGNDITGDGSFDAPFLTLSKAITIANGIASLLNPIAISINPGIYVENNSAGPLTVTAAGVSIVGTCASSAVIIPNTPANDLLLVTNTIRIFNIAFQSPAPLATGISLTAGNLTVLNNVRLINFLVGVNCAGGPSQSYGFNLCLFIQNGTALNINNTTVECNSCFISGASSMAGPAANIGVSVTGASTRFVINTGVIGLCATGCNITGNAITTISGVNFRRNTFDVIQTGASHVTMSACTMEMTNTPADINIQVSGAGTNTDIIGCEFNGNDSGGVPQATGIIIINNAVVNMSGGTMRNYTTGIQIGNPADTSSTKLDASSFIINGCTDDIIQDGSATLAFHASTASSSKISVNDPTNVELAFFDLDDNGALTIGSTADIDTTLMQAAIAPINHPGINYKSSLYTAQAIGVENVFNGPSALYSLGIDHTAVLSITTDRTKVSVLRLVSDEGSPVGGVTALRGWDINKNASTAELAFRYQNSDIVGQIVVPQHTVMQLDGFNNQLQLPTAGTHIVFSGDTNLYRDSANVLKTDDNLIVDTLTPDRVVVTNSITNQLESSIVTGTELGYLSGVTSPIQTQLNGKVAKSGDIMTGTLELPAGTTAAPSLTFTGSTTTGLSAPIANSLSLSTNAVERMAISSTGIISIDAFTTAGVVHNNASGDLSSSLIVDADITNATISNVKLATIASGDVPSNIVVRDGSGDFATNMITLNGTVTNPTDAATKAYVDAAISLGLVAKTPALVISTTDIGSPPTGLIVIDGVALAVNDRVLLTGQTNPVENGLWLAQVAAWTRPADFANGTPAGQAYVLILSGTAYTGSSWLCNTPTAIIGTDPIGFSLFSLPDTTLGANVGAGTGLVFRNKTGVTLNFRTLLADPHMVVTTNANDITIGTDATDVNTPSTIVARDGLGNFSAGTITASLTGAASDNVLKIGDTMTGALQLPAGTVLAPSLNFTGSTTTGLSAPIANSLSFSTNALERMNISSTGVVSINAFTTAGVVHNDASGNLSTSLIVNADVDPAAAIVDTKLATISTAGKVANSATTATSLNVPNAIVARDGSGNFSAGTIIASLMGAASDNVLKAGDTMTGSLQLPAGTTALPSLTFTGSATTGLSASAGDLSFSTTALERLKISSGGTISIDAFTVAGVVHNDASGDLSSSLIVDADVDPAAGIIDTKLATISTAGKVANSATTATDADVSNAIVSRDPSGNFTTNMITIDGTTTNPTDVATKAYVDSQIGSTGTNLNIPNTLVKRDGTGSFAAQVVSVVDVVASGTLTILPFAVAGVVHNNASGLLSTSLIVDADITNATISNAKLATASSADLPGYIVVRDGSGNFATNMITIDGAVTNPTDVATKAYVDGQISGTGTNLNTPNALVRRDGTGSFAAQVVSVVDSVASGNLILSTEPSTSAAGNILKGSNRFIHNFGTNNTFVGIDAGNFTMTGTDNIGFGKNAFQNNTTGNFNIGIGNSALQSNTTGINNTAVGNATFPAVTTGSTNIAIGSGAGGTLTTGSGNIYINANAGAAAESTTIRIGTSQTKTFVAGILGVTPSTGPVPVLVSLGGQLGTAAIETFTVTANGQSFAVANTTSILILSTVANRTNFTVTFPGSPANGQVFAILTTSTNSIGLINNGNGATVANGITTLDANATMAGTTGGAAVSYLYTSGTNTWNRYYRG